MSDIQAKRLITWRVDPGLLARIDARAKQLNRSRSAFLVWAAENALGDAAGGVPDLPEEVRVPDFSPREVLGPKPARESFVSGEDWQNAVRLWKGRQG